MTQATPRHTTSRHVTALPAAHFRLPRRRRETEPLAGIVREILGDGEAGTGWEAALDRGASAAADDAWEREEA